jgi:hypothetical protein
MMREYLEQLNQTTLNYNNDWKDYRNSISPIIDKYTEGKTLIIGLGNGNDLDLKNIIKKSTFLEILDLDIVSVSRCLETYGDIEYSLKEFDLNFIREFDIKNLDNIFDVINENFVDFKIYFQKKFYDTIIISPIFSQLLYNIVFTFHSLTDSQIEDLMDFSKRQIEYIGEFINYILNNNGRLIILNDLVSTSEKVENMELFCDNYFLEYGISPNKYAQDLINQNKIIEHEEYFNWYFNNNQNFIVKMTITRKEK